MQFDIELPDKRVVTIEAADQTTALRGAQEWSAANPLKENVAADVAKSGGIGLAKGAIGLAGMPGDIGSLVGTGVDWAGSKLGLDPQRLQTAKGKVSDFVRHTPSPLAAFAGPGSADIQKTIEGFTGKFYKPKTVAGEYAQTAGEFAPGLALPGGWVRRLAQTFIPALTSETAGQATKGSDIEGWARLGGALAGAAAPSAFSRAITPFPASQARTAAVNTLADEGVTVTAGQATGRKRLQATESELGGGRGADIMETQAEQFTAAALRRIGETANRADEHVLNRAYTRIGQQFDSIGARNTLLVDRGFSNDMANLQGTYTRFANPAQKQAVHDAVNDVIGIVQRNGGSIPGAEYIVMRSRIGESMRAARRGGDNQVANAYSDMIEALDGAMSRSMRAAGNTTDIAALREARNQYRNFLTVERAVTNSAGAAGTGLITPAALTNAVKAVEGRRSLSLGRSDFDELAKAGAQVMAPLPNSGTPIRTSAWNFGMSPSGAALGASIGSIGGPGYGTAIGGLVGGYLPAVTGRLAMTRPGQAYLGNQIMAPSLATAPAWLQQAVASSLLARPQVEALPPRR